MRVTIVQMDLEWAKPQVNLARAEKAIVESPQSDLYILPEMFSTGFCTEPENVADREKLACSWMLSMASKMDAAICGSVATQEDGKCYNRFYFVKPSGEITYYDKKHLFTYGGENLHYTPGNQRVIVSFRGVRILLQVCYDLRFPLWARNRKDYDMIVYVASWPTSRLDAWKILVKARAIENQCFVAAVNRVGSDPNCAYSGGSAVIDPYGKVMVACDDGVAMTAHTVVDMAMLENFRKKFPVLEDADSFELI